MASTLCPNGKPFFIKKLKILHIDLALRPESEASRIFLARIDFYKRHKYCCSDFYKRHNFYCCSENPGFTLRTKWEVYLVCGSVYGEIFKVRRHAKHKNLQLCFFFFFFLVRWRYLYQTKMSCRGLVRGIPPLQRGYSSLLLVWMCHWEFEIGRIRTNLQEKSTHLFTILRFIRGFWYILNTPGPSYALRMSCMYNVTYLGLTNTTFHVLFVRMDHFKVHLMVASRVIDSKGLMMIFFFPDKRAKLKRFLFNWFESWGTRTGIQSPRFYKWFHFELALKNIKNGVS